MNSQTSGPVNASTEDLQLVFSIKIGDHNSFPIKIYLDLLFSRPFLLFYLLLLAQKRFECIQSTAMASPVTTESCMTTTLAVWALNILDL